MSGMGRERDPHLDEPVVTKAYYSIGEVCELTGLKAHVLRYWESQFPSLQPSKNQAGNRVYRPKEIELILLVKHLLYEEKFTIDGARRRLEEMRGAGELEETRKGVLEKEVLASLREDLQSLLQVLRMPERPGDA